MGVTLGFYSRETNGHDIVKKIVGVDRLEKVCGNINIKTLH